MYRIYIRNYIGAASPTEDALFDSSDVMNSESDRTVLDPVVKNELNKAGSLEFTVTPANPFYDKIKIVKTIFTVYLDDVMIFRGRVMTISDDIFKQRGIFCEGELAYLNDSLQPPVKEQYSTIYEYMHSVISDHNQQMNLFKYLVDKTDNIDKCFDVGTVDVGDGRISYKITSDTKEVISERESESFGNVGHNAVYRDNDIYVNTSNTAAFSWELNGIRTTDGMNADNLLRIRTSNALYVRRGSVIMAKAGYKAYVCRYSRYSDANDFDFISPGVEITDSYSVPDDCYIRIAIAKVPDEDSENEDLSFTQEDAETVPEDAVILTGLVIIGSILYTAPMVSTPFNNSGYRNSFDVIQNDLIDIYGGYISVRYEDGHRYIDYTSDPPNNTGEDRIISFGVNLQEVSKEISAEDLYSVLLPTGDSDLLLTKAAKNQMISGSSSMYMLPLNAVKTYGPIFKTQSFSGISKREELRDYAGNFISKTWRGASESYTFKTVDMHFVDDSRPLILVGSRCAITLWPDTAPKMRICTGVTYELQAPENNEHVFEDLPYEREGLTKKYKKQSSGRGGSGAVSTAPVSTEVGSGAEDTIIRSNGNIILYPGQDKMVSIPLAPTFLAPSLTEWMLGGVTYKTAEGLKIPNDTKIEKDLFVEGRISVGTDIYKNDYGSGTVYAAHQVRTDGHMKSPIYWVRPGRSSGSGLYRITYGEKTGYGQDFSPHQLTLIGGTDQKGDPIPLTSMWVLANEDVNFNIAESKWFKDQMGSANVDIVLESIQFDNPVSGKSVLKEHGKAVSLKGSIYLGKAVEVDIGPGITETIVERLKDQNGSEKPPLPFTSQDVTSVYDEGYEDALSGVIVYPQNWEYTIEDDESEYYRMLVQARAKKKFDSNEHDVGCDTYEVILPDVEAVLYEPANDGSWWKTTGTYTNQYVIPAHSAKAYLKSDTNHEHVLDTDSGSAIVIDPQEAIRLGKSQVGLKDPEWIDGSDPTEDHPNTYLISTDGRVNSTTGAANEVQKYLVPEAAIKSVKVDTVALNGEYTYTPGNHSAADPGYYDVPVKATATNENYKDETLQVIPTAAWLDGFTTGQGSGTTAGYTTGYTNGQANVSASIAAAGFTSGSFAYDGTDLAVAVSASGTLTKIPETGDPVVSSLSYSGIVGIPVSVDPVVLSAGKWNSETNKIKIGKASGGTVTIDDEPISVSVTEKEITVTPGTVTFGNPSYTNGSYTITADGTVDINGDICNLTQGSKTFPADSAIRAGREAAQQDLYLDPGSVTASWNENAKAFDLSCTSNVYSSADASADTLRTETGTGSLSVSVGTAMPKTPQWDPDNLVYNISASGGFTVGEKLFAQAEGSIENGFYPEAAINYGYNNGWGEAVGDISYPTKKNTSSESISIWIPSETVDGNPVELKYTVSVDNQYVYLKNKSNVIVAQAVNTGTTIIKGSIASVTQAIAATYDNIAKEYSVYPRVNGINLIYENNRYDAAPLKVSSSEAVEQGWREAYSKLTPPNAYAGAAEKLDFSVGIPLETYGTDGTYDFTLHKGTPKAENGFAFVKQGSNVVAKIDISNWYTDGQQSVSVSNAEIASGSVMYSSRPVTGTLNVTLDNGKSASLQNVNLDDVYQSGLDGDGKYYNDADFNFSLTDGSTSWIKPKSVNVSAVYQKGVDDGNITSYYTRITESTNSTTADYVAFYKTLGNTLTSNEQWGKLLPNTEAQYLDKITKTQTISIGSGSIAYPREYYRVNYDGVIGYIVASRCEEPYTPARGDNGGWYGAPPVDSISSVEVEVLEHIGYNDTVNIIVDPVKGSKTQYESIYTENPMGITDADTEKYLDLIDGVFATHSVNVYSGTLTHRAKLKVTWTLGNVEHVVIGFDSVAVAPSVLYVSEITELVHKASGDQYSYNNRFAVTLEAVGLPRRAKASINVSESDYTYKYKTTSNIDVGDCLTVLKSPYYYGEYDPSSLIGSYMKHKAVLAVVYDDGTEGSVCVEFMSYEKPTEIKSVDVKAIRHNATGSNGYSGTMNLVMYPNYPTSSGSYPNSYKSYNGSYSDGNSYANANLPTYFARQYSEYIYTTTNPGTIEIEDGPGITHTESKGVLHTVYLLITMTDNSKKYYKCTWGSTYNPYA